MKTFIPVTIVDPTKTRFPILIKGSHARLCADYRNICAEMKINPRKFGRDVTLTQVAELGTSFTFDRDLSQREFHLPARLVARAFTT
ncbi:MAG: hypothetical protein KGL39_22850 [Patescibacteria group bacterium]|nr:hypothetical protein [Patescibacteria group bacterium]